MKPQKIKLTDSGFLTSLTIGTSKAYPARLLCGRFIFVVFVERADDDAAALEERGGQRRDSGTVGFHEMRRFEINFGIFYCNLCFSRSADVGRSMNKST